MRKIIDLVEGSEQIVEDWDHYTEIGHKKGSSIVWYMLKGGKMIERPFNGKKDNHDVLDHEGDEARSIAVGRIDPIEKKISVRTPLAPGNSFYMLPQAKLDFIVSKLKKKYPDYAIWYFGNAATDIRRIDETEILDEMPMALNQVGDWSKNSSFKDQDRKLLNNPKAVKKIQAMWKYPEDIDYNVILINNAEANRYTELGLIGDPAVATNWLETNMPKTAPELIPMLNGEMVNILFTNNKGSQRVPFTGWIAAHRMAHCLFAMGKSYYFNEAASTLARYLGELAQQYNIELNGVGRGNRDYNALLSTTTRSLMTALCTFKSARDNKLRNTFEALHELFAQYVLTGKLTFNELPDGVKVGRVFYSYQGGDDRQYDNRAIQQDLAYELEQYFETAVHQSVGKVFVM